MKNYKLLIPFALIFLYAASIVMTLQAKEESESLYTSCLDQARDYAEQGIPVDAEKFYRQALELKPSPELYLEIGKFFIDTGQIRGAQEWAQAFIGKYPKLPAAYEFAAGFYRDCQDYVMCFRLFDQMEKRKVTSTYLQELMASIKYEYYLEESFDEVSVFSGGYCAVRTGERWGYVDQRGRKVIAAQFASAGPFYGERAVVTDSGGEIYYIDAGGNKKMVLNGIEGAAEAGPLYDGVFPVFDGSVWSFYDDQKTLLSGGYEDCSAMINGVAAVKKDGRWGLLDRQGQLLTEFQFEDVIIDGKGAAYRNDRLFALDGSYYRLIDTAGSAVGAESFDDARLFSDAACAAVKKDGKWGFVDKDGNMVIQPQYEDAGSFSNGLAAVRVGGKWGFINTENEMVIAPAFEDAGIFTGSGSVFVNNGEGWTLLRLYQYNH